MKMTSNAHSETPVFAVRFINPAASQIPSRDHVFLHQVKDCISKNIANKEFNAGELALTVNLSVSQLNRKLNSLIGFPAGKLIRNVRMQYAANLLTRNANSIGEIAYQTGFFDQAHFCRSFKQFFKCTPSDYKKHHHSLF